VTIGEPPVSLEPLGWDSSWSVVFEQRRRPGADARPGRVGRVDRGRCVVLTDEGPVQATLGGGVLERMAEDGSQAPCTGDWCVLRAWPDGPVTIEDVLPRRTAVVRADVGGSSRGQVLAANLDVVGLVVGLVPEPTVARVERLAAVAWASGAAPIVILTKSDLVNDAAQIADDVAVAVPGATVLVCSVMTGEGMAAVRELVTPNRTVGLLGASGAGKSSLINTLAGAPELRTREIREDGRGRHTSVRRELVALPGGGAVIDTPGLRGIGLVDADEGLSATFADVDALAARCRFKDCSHTVEPGCAVLEAANSGELPVRRLQSWRKLQREMAWMNARADARLRAERAKVWKQQSKAHRRGRRPAGGHDRSNPDR
jgi:ribosome biogenesis GTPase